MERTIYEIDVSLSRALDLRDRAVLRKLGVTREDLEDPLFVQCQEVGGAVAWLDADGLFVPSARNDSGSNLVIFPTGRHPDEAFEVMGRETIAEARR